MALNMGKREDSVDIRFRKPSDISPDLKDVVVLTEPRGIHGWAVHLCFVNDKCCDFSVDRGNYDDKDMCLAVERVITKQLKYHEEHKSYR